MTTTTLLLLWIVPPVTGAIIGYFTNAVAIKMLFRPLTEKRLFGFRVPFTPGILPKQRHELAKSIGRMVERELLTPEIVRQRLARQDVRDSFLRTISNFTAKTFSTPLKDFLKSLETASDVGKEGGASFPSGLFQGFFRSSAFEALFESVWKLATEKGAATLGDKSLREIVGDERVNAIRTSLEKSVQDTLRSKSGYISAQASVMFYNMFSQIEELLLNFLNRADVRRVLEHQGRVFVSGAIKKLSGAQRFFVSLGGYDETLSNKMPEIIDDLVNQISNMLESQEERHKIADFVRLSLDSFLTENENGVRITKSLLTLAEAYTDKPLKDFFTRVSAEKTAETTEKLGKQVFAVVQNFLESRFTNEASGADGTSTGENNSVGDFFKKLLEDHGDWTPESVFLITPEKKAALDAFICEKILALADEQIGAALTSINVQLLVSERIDELDMVRVERIILDIMADQLKWINILGGVLGGIIGLFQAGFSWFMRAYF